MSSSDNDPKKAEDMSLSDLLKNSQAPADNSNSSTDEPLEDGSGLINLSQMVQQASAAATPPPAVEQPPLAAAQSPYGAAPAPGPQAFGAPQPTSSGYPGTPQQTAASFPDPGFADIGAPKKKSKPVLIIAIVILMGLAAGAFVALSGNSDDDSDKTIAQAEADLAARQPNAGNIAAAPPTTTEPEEPASEDAAGNEPQEEAAADDQDDIEISEEEVEEEIVDTKTGKKKKRRVVRRAKSKASASNAGKSSSSVAATKSTANKATAAQTAAPVNKKPAGKTSELDSLLASGGAKNSGGGLPQKPSRKQVQSAMRPVQSKAKNVCSKSGSGKVNVRIIVGSNGVVRDAIPTGAHSADSLGRCVATIARRTAKLPKFKSPTFTFTYPFNI